MRGIYRAAWMAGLLILQVAGAKAEWTQIWSDFAVDSKVCHTYTEHAAFYQDGNKQSTRFGAAEPVKAPGFYTCFYIDLPPRVIGVWSVKTADHPERFQAAIGELTAHDGYWYLNNINTNDRMLTGKRNGRIMIVPPKTAQRRLLLVMRYIDGPPMSALVSFNRVDPLWEMMVILGRSLVTQLVVGAAVEGMGFEGKKAEVAKVVAQLAIGLAMTADSADPTDDAVLGAATTLAPKLFDNAYVTGGAYLTSCVQVIWRKVFAGFDQEVKAIPIY